MASPTVLSVGSVTVTANGGYTGDLLAKVTTAAAAYTVITVGPGAGNTSDTIPAAPTTGGPFELVIQPGYSGPLVIPTGYALVINGATADTNTITGGDPTTIIMGSDLAPLNYSGGALTVIGGAGGGSVTDTADGATLAFISGSYSINAVGNGDIIELGTSSSGTGAAAASTGGDVVTVTGTNSTVTANAGADTIFAHGGGTDFIGTAASSSVFIGSNTGAVTVTSATNQSIFGGTAGGTYTEGADSTGSFFFWGNHAGVSPTVPTSDTLFGTASSPNGLIWGASQENTVVSQSGAGAALGGGNTFVAYGDADTINAAASRGGDSFIVFNIAFTTDPANNGHFAGNTTLVGSTQGNELFGIFDNLGFGTSEGNHTITIQNWVSTDVLGLGGYKTETGNTADLTTANTALAAAKGGSAQFTLSDGTTIKFEGVAPTSVGYHI
jgi:hypothetical protein